MPISLFYQNVYRFLCQAGFPPLFGMNLVIDLFEQVPAQGVLKIIFIHEAGFHLNVVFHPVDEDVLQHREERYPKFSVLFGI